MTRQAKTVLAAALRLPPNARAALAAGLIESLEDDAGDEDAEAAWSEEIRRRLAEFDAGKVTAIPWSRARRQIRAAASGRGRGR